MKIIIELSLCINLIVNAFIIKSTSLFLKEKAKLWWLSSILGSVVALILPLFNLNAYLTILVQVLLSAMMVSISFNFKTIKKFFIIYPTFLGFTFVFGGGCYALQQAFGQISLLCVLIVVSIIQCACVTVIKYKNKLQTIQTFSYMVRLRSNGKLIEEEGYLDSGNMLYDPITKKPIILITFDVFSKIYENVNYINAYLKNVDVDKLCNGHYIKINSVASGASILVFTAEEIEIIKDKENKKFEQVAVGLSFSGFDKSLGRKILLHSELL